MTPFNGINHHDQAILAGSILLIMESMREGDPARRPLVAMWDRIQTHHGAMDAASFAQLCYAKRAALEALRTYT